MSAYGGVIFSCLRGTIFASGMLKFHSQHRPIKLLPDHGFYFRIVIPGVPISIILSDEVQVALYGFLKQKIHVQLLQSSYRLINSLGHIFSHFTQHTISCRLFLPIWSHIYEVSQVGQQELLSSNQLAYIFLGRFKYASDILSYLLSMVYSTCQSEECNK